MQVLCSGFLNARNAPEATVPFCGITLPGLVSRILIEMQLE